MKCLVLALALFASPAWAVDFSAVITDDEGKPMKLCTEQVKPGEVCPKETEITLGFVARSALYASFPDEQNLSGEEKFRRAELAFATKNAGDYKLLDTDKQLLKKLIAKLYNPLVVYRAWSLLDPPK